MNPAIRAYKNQLPVIAENCYIDSSATVIGKVQLGADCSVWPLTVIRGDVNNIYIGARSNIQDGSIIHVSRPSEEYPEGFATHIGSEVTIGHKAMLHGCRIGHRVMVGMGAIVLDGAQIEESVIIAAGSLVPPGKIVASGYLYMGSPIKKIRPLSKAEEASLSHNADHYVHLKNNYLNA